MADHFFGAAVAAVARKLLVQVWHLLSGNPPIALEAGKSLTLKLQRLVSALGKSLRAESGLTGSLNQCVLELQRRLLSSPPMASQ